MFWNALNKPRRTDRGAVATVEKAVPHYKQHDLSFPKWPVSEPININYMEQITERFNGLTLPEKELASQAIMKQLVRNPEHGIALETPYFQSRFQDQEIYLGLLAATYFGQGRTQEAAQVVEHIVRQFPTPYNFSYLVHCYNALNRIDSALDTLDLALKHYPEDYYLLREKALYLYLQHRTPEANAILDQVRPLLYEDPEQQPAIEAARRLNEELNRAKASSQVLRFSDSDVYDDDYTRSTWWSYWIEYNAYSPYQFVGAWVRQAIQDRLRDLVLMDPKVANVIDFGVLCAEPNYRVAQCFPNVRFTGLDRQPLVKEMNEHAYGHMDNMAFYAGDVLDVLPHMVSPQETSAFFHCRTGCFLYPAHLQQIYQRCADLDVRYIALYETTAISRLSYTYYDFDKMPMDTIPNKSALYIHNYGRILEVAGYRIIKEERLSTHSLVDASIDIGGAASFILAEKQS